MNLAFFEENLQLSSAQLSGLLSSHPQLLMLSLDTLEGCWKRLSDTYNIPTDVICKMIIKLPRVLSKATISRHQERIDFLSYDLNFPPPFSAFQKLTQRFPEILFLDLDFFLRPNTKLLKDFLVLNDEGVSKLIMLSPRVLYHNPKTLESRLRSTLYLLTSNQSFLESSPPEDSFCAERTISSLVLEGEDQEEEDSFDIDGWLYSDQDVIDTALIENYGEDFELMSDVHPELLEDLGAINLDLIFDIVYDASSCKPHIETEYSSTLMEQSVFSEESLDTISRTIFQSFASSLSIDLVRARHIVSTVPWLISYRPQRNLLVISALAVSLGMSRAEISKCVGTYPRLLCLGVDGKITRVLRVLANGAFEWTKASARNNDRNSGGADLSEADVLLQLSGLESNEINRSAVIYRRQAEVRLLLRQIILRYPNILGSDVLKIQTAIADVLKNHLPFGNVVRYLRSKRSSMHAKL